MCQVGSAAEPRQGDAYEACFQTTRVLSSAAESDLHEGSRGGGREAVGGQLSVKVVRLPALRSQCQHTIGR